jgi:hypothetical protein
MQPAPPKPRRVYVFHDGENAFIPPTVTDGSLLYRRVLVRGRALWSLCRCCAVAVVHRLRAVKCGACAEASVVVA